MFTHTKWGAMDKYTWLVSKGVMRVLGDGRGVSFRYGKLVGEETLATKFPRLFSNSLQKINKLAEMAAWTGDLWPLHGADHDLCGKLISINNSGVTYNGSYHLKLKVMNGDGVKDKQMIMLLGRCMRICMLRLILLKENSIYKCGK